MQYSDFRVKNAIFRAIFASYVFSTDFIFIDNHLVKIRTDLAPMVLEWFLQMHVKQFRSLHTVQFTDYIQVVIFLNLKPEEETDGSSHFMMFKISTFCQKIVHILCNNTFKFEPKNRRDERFLKIKKFKCIFRVLSVKFAILTIFVEYTNYTYFNPKKSFKNLLLGNCITKFNQSWLSWPRRTD